MSSSFNETIASLGDMNPFDNNKPRLTASERIQNKKSKAIYDAAKLKFQSTNACGGKNVRFYKKGTVRSVSSYETQRDLAKGNALCTDCNNQGMLCGPEATPNMFGKITMGNNLNSERWGGGTMFLDISVFPFVWRQSPADVVMTSDVSGTWDPSAATVDDPSKNILPTYGYLNNLFKIPRNLDGTSIVIDPSNTLFAEDACSPFQYMESSYLKTNIVVKGLVFRWEFVQWVSDCSNSDFIGSFVTQRPDTGGGVGFSGVITNICCTGITEEGLTIPDIGFPGPAMVLEVHIAVFHYSNRLPIPDKPTGGSYTTPGGFSYAESWHMSIWSKTSTTATGQERAAMYSESTEYLHVGQGDCSVGINLSTKNKTKQSYMHCLEDGTKKINFS